jgi:phage terminase small subunit
VWAWLCCNSGIRENLLEGQVSNPKTPAGLSAEASRLFHETVKEYGLDDAPSLVLLTNACLALMRLREAEGIVKKEGSVYRDRFNQWKRHPAAARVDAENLTLQRSLRELGISLAPATNHSRVPEGI